MPSEEPPRASATFGFLCDDLTTAVIALKENVLSFKKRQVFVGILFEW